MPEACVRHRHRTTWRGLFRLYAKNAVANCLLSRRYPHYAAYPEVRTFAWLGRECLRSALAGTLGRRPDDGDAPTEHFAAAVRYAGEMWGWLRWRTAGAGT